QVRLPPPHTSLSALVTADMVRACRSAKPDHGIEVSKVSAMTLVAKSAARPYGARTNELRHEPDAPSPDEPRIPSGAEPSRPRKRRSGDGPAPEPGSRRLSLMPAGVTTRSDSAKSSMWV